MLLLSVPVVLGAEEDIAAVSAVDNEQFLTYMDFFDKIGLLEGLPEEAIDPEHLLTRAEFATLAANMTGILSSFDEGLEDVYSKFTDVEDDYWAADAIKLITEMGHINGNPDGTFAPDEPILYMQAVKIMVSMLGYDPFAIYEGGYPIGYLSVAQSKRLIKRSITVDDAITFDAAASLLYETLNAEVLLSSSGTFEEFYTVDGETMLKRNMGILRAKNQIITATAITSLTGDGKVRVGEIKADGVLYKEGSSNASQYLGYSATLFYTEEDGVNTIVFMELDADRNETVTIQAEDIVSYAGHVLTVLEGNKEEEYDVSLGADILYNGMAAVYDDELFDLPRGSITFIDNNRDDEYDVISIRVFQDIVIGSIDYLGRKLFNKYPLRDQAGINIDPYSVIEVMPDALHTYVIMDQAGEALVFEDLSAGDLVSVYISQDGTYKEIVLCSEKLTGVLTEINDTEVVIGENIYDVADYLAQTGMQLDQHIGEEGSFRLDAEGKIALADFTGVSIMRYGYLIDMMHLGGVKDVYRLKLLDEDGTIQYYDVDDKFVLDGESVKAANVLDPTFRWTAAQLREEGYVDAATGELTIEEGAFKRQLVKYRVSADSLVKEIDTAKLVDKSEDGELTQVRVNGVKAVRKYKLYSRSFALEFNVTDGTKLFRVPDVTADTNDDKDFDCITPTTLQHDHDYTVEGFDFEDGFVAKAAVVYVDEGSQGTPPVTSSFVLVDRVTETVIDEDGEIGYKLYCLAGGKFSEYPAEKDVLVVNGRLPKRGDVVRFGTDRNGKITTISLILDIDTLDKTQTAFLGSFFTNYYAIQGPVVDKGNGYFVIKGQKGTTVGEVCMSVPITGSFYVYDSVLDRISNGSADDLICADSVAEGASYVLVRMNYESCQEVIIFK